MVYIFRCVGGVKSRSEAEESWQAVFWRSVAPERMNIVFIRGDGPAEWSSIEGIFLFSSESHSFQRLTITWAPWRRGILVYPGFYSI